jgi:hypothetical protein
MATQPKPARSGSLRRLLQESSPSVRYDAARGLARHEQLVASQSPLPEWASGLTPSASTRIVSAFAKRAWWLGGALIVAGALWLGASGVRRAESASHDLAAATQAPAAKREPRPGPARAPSAPERRAVEPLGRTTSPDVGSRAVGPRAGSTAAGEGAAVGREEGTQVLPGPMNDVREDTTLLPASSGPVVPASGARADPRASTAEPHVLDSAPTSRAAARASASDLDARAQEPRVLPRSASASAPQEGSTRAALKTRSRVAAGSPRDAEEMRQLAEAERLLAPEPVRALRIAREGQVAFRSGYFAQERRYIEVMALFALGRHGEAHAHAAWFLRDFPDGPYRHRIETELLRFPVH